MPERHRRPPLGWRGRCTRQRRIRVVKRKVIASASGFLIFTLASDALGGHHEPAVLPGEHPDTGAEWAYSPTFDRMTLANGSNTRFANAGVARGVGMAFDPSIRLDRTRAA